ncbi:MAG: hypothetical protein AB7S75_11215 [Desulfococcaceae bacterium]
MFSIMESDEEWKPHPHCSQEKDIAIFQEKLLNQMIVSDVTRSIRNTHILHSDIAVYRNMGQTKGSAVYPNPYIADSGKKIQITPKDGEPEDIPAEGLVNRRIRLSENHLEETYGCNISEAMRYDSGFIMQEETAQNYNAEVSDSLGIGTFPKGSWYISGMSIDPEQEKAIADAILTIDFISTKTMSLLGIFIENIRALRNPIFMAFGLITALVILIKK